MYLFVDKFKRPDNKYYLNDMDRYGWDNPLEFIHEGILGFCGCGRIEPALIKLRNILRQIDKISLSDKWAEGMNTRHKLAYKDKGLEWLTYYCLESLDLLVHGGCLPGWLSELGKGILQDLEVLLKDSE